MNMANQSDQIMHEARQARHRIVYNRSIGMKSRALKKNHFWKKVGRIAIAAGVITVGLGIIGTIINGIGFTGVMLGGLAIAASPIIFANYPKMRVPSADSLPNEKLEVLAGKTEIWLETQRPALPAPAVKLIDGIGVQLDALAPQLQTLDEREPAAMEVRKLVGEHLPELITGFRKIPPHLQKESRNGRTPEEQLVGGLKTIGQEIDGMTRKIANGELDKLAVRERYLELKYDKSVESE